MKKRKNIRLQLREPLVALEDECEKIKSNMSDELLGSASNNVGISVRDAVCLEVLRAARRVMEMEELERLNREHANSKERMGFSVQFLAEILSGTLKKKLFEKWN